MQKTKVCPKCNKELPASKDYFHAHKAGKYGLHTYCKKCRNKEKRERRIKEKIENGTYIKAKEGYQICSKCGEEKPLTERYFHRRRNGENGWRNQCIECRREYGKEYSKIYWQDGENRERAKEWREENRELVRELNRKWRRENRNKVNVIKERYRTRKKGLPATLTNEQWANIKKDFNYECAYCGMTEEEHFEEFSENLHQEHFIPVSKGGEYTHNNIIPACRKCNTSKSNDDFFDWYPQYEYYSKEREERILDYLEYNEDIQQLSII